MPQSVLIRRVSEVMGAPKRVPKLLAHATGEHPESHDRGVMSSVGFQDTSDSADDEGMKLPVGHHNAGVMT